MVTDRVESTELLCAGLSYHSIPTDSLHFRHVCTIIIGSSYNFRFPSFFCVLYFIKVKLSVKVKLFVSLLCVCAILPAKAVPEMTYTVLGGTLNPTHSDSDSLQAGKLSWYEASHLGRLSLLSFVG